VNPRPVRSSNRVALTALAATAIGWAGLYFLREPFGVRFWLAVAAALGGPLVVLGESCVHFLSARSRLKSVIALTVLALSTALALGLIVLILSPRHVAYHHVTTEEWRADLREIGSRVGKTHPAIYADMDEGSYLQALRDLDSRIEELPDDQIIAEMMRIAAMLGDGRTSLLPLLQLTGFHAYPIQLRYFADGLYVTRAIHPYSDLVGKRITAFSGHDVESVHSAMAELVTAANTTSLRERIPWRLIVPELLQAAGILDESGAVTLSVASDSGAVSERSVEPASALRTAYWLWRSPDGLSIARPWLTDSDHYRFEFLESSQTLHLQIDRFINRGDEGLSELCRRALGEAARLDAARFVIDLRESAGPGNDLHAGAFIEELIADESYNRWGRLFVLIGPRTARAGLRLAADLEQRTRATFVGLPTAAGPNHLGVLRMIGLLGSGIRLYAPTRYWMGSTAGDTRDSIAPHLRIEPTYAEWAEGRDVTLEAVESYEVRPRPEPGWQPAAPENFVGDFAFDFDAVLHIRLDDGQLHASVRHFIETELIPDAPGIFLAGIRDTRIVGEAPEDAPVESIFFERAGKRRKLRRLAADHVSPIAQLWTEDYPKAVASYRRVHRGRPFHRALDERRLNRIGYALMNGNRLEAAKEVLQMNSEFYSESFNAFDSAGEAYLRLGQLEKAFEKYTISLALNPDNGNARRKLTQIESARE